MCAYSIQRLPERMIRAADVRRRKLPAAFARLEAELELHALPRARAPRLADAAEHREKEDVDAAA